MKSSRQQSGFTLLEILVAASIFSIMSVIAITGIKTVLDSQEQTDKVTAQMKSLQTTLFHIEQDLQFVSNRSIRDEYGDTQAALKAGNSGIQGLAITRSGIRNPQGLKRSNLIRVQYWLDDGTLMRGRFKSLDRGQDKEAIERKLIDKIDEFEFRFLNSKNEWSGFWPPISTGSLAPAGLPKAIEISLTHNSLGNIKRLIALPH